MSCLYVCCVRVVRRDTPLLSALRPLVTVLASQPMAMALKLVQDCGHSSAAVVDDEGTYVGCIRCEGCTRRRDSTHRRPSLVHHEHSSSVIGRVLIPCTM